MVAIGHAGLHSRSMATVQLYYVLSKLYMHAFLIVVSFIYPLPVLVLSVVKLLEFVQVSYDSYCSLLSFTCRSR